MASLDEYLARATAAGPDRTLPGCVMIAYKDGKAHYKAFGTESVDPSLPQYEKPLSVDSYMWVASCTKLMTAIAALQCVEKGLLTLDDDISVFVPEWTERKILRGFDEATGIPLLEAAKGKLSLRMLLTHSSGLGYAFIHEPLAKYIKYKVANGWELESELLVRPMCPDVPVPLLFEPATNWSYGIGTDWAGKLVERVNGQSLGKFMQQNIWKPLGMGAAAFRIHDRPDIRDRQAQMSIRNGDGTLGPHPRPYFPENTSADHGGGGVFTNPRDYFKVLVACVNSDPVLLTPASYELLCEPSLTLPAAAAFQTMRTQALEAANAAAEQRGTPMTIPGAKQWTWAVGGSLNLDDVPGGRRAGTIAWGGLPNLSWTVDRASGVAVLYASQLLPPGEALTAWVVRQLEAEVYSGAFFDGASVLGEEVKE
ncbi:hypothetical protein SBRCBS47491_003759 [Sporothrix bragantina]|uniref:Beta-lactamase-related domain-containing protein n=1 Tax=Sporothrix bragantina TaxID=671064 RepID=A0ABP0BI52_9PEZI